MTGNHTPTPWRVERHPDTSRYFGNLVGSYGPNEMGVERIRTITCQLRYGPADEQEANAEFIVTAVNSYASSQAEIERLRAALDRQCDNMAFVLNRVDLHGFHRKFEREVTEDRAMLAALSGSKE